MFGVMIYLKTKNLKNFAPKTIAFLTFFSL